MLELVGSGLFDIAISVPLFLEYEDALSRAHLALAKADRDAVLDYICAIAVPQPTEGSPRSIPCIGIHRRAGLLGGYHGHPVDAGNAWKT